MNQLGARPTGDHDGGGGGGEGGRVRVRSPPDQQHSFVTIYYETFSAVILSLPLIQEVQLFCTNQCAQYWLTA